MEVNEVRGKRTHTDLFVCVWVFFLSSSHLFNPLKKIRDRCNKFFSLWYVSAEPKISCRQSLELVCATKISIFKETTVLCTFACHQKFFFTLDCRNYMDDIMLQLTGTKHSYFRAVACFQGDDIQVTQYR